jgi:hypothetical protein
MSKSQILLRRRYVISDFANSVLRKLIVAIKILGAYVRLQLCKELIRISNPSCMRQNNVEIAVLSLDEFCKCLRSRSWCRNPYFTGSR